MTRELETPFDSIEGAQEYLKLLSEAVSEAKQAVEADVVERAYPESDRRLEALRLVLYKLERLDQHLTLGRRILNDLRTLRRLLMEERTAEEKTDAEVPNIVAHEVE